MYRHTLSFAAIMSAFVAPAHSQVVEAIGAAIVEFNRKCGPLSGKLPKDFTEEEKAYCDGLVKNVNEFLGTSDGGFTVRPDVVRAWSKKPLQSLGGIGPCDKTSHVPANAKYMGSLNIQGGHRGNVCTGNVPNDEPINKLTCEVDGGGLPRESCSNTGEFSDCSYVATITIEARPSLEGNKYCWWVYNQSDHERVFSISFK